MMQNKKIVAILCIVSLCISGIAEAAKRDIQELKEAVEQMDVRLQKLEVSRDNQILLELMKSIDQLKEEVQQLRGDLEQLTHDVDGMSNRQRNLYMDIDRRLNDLQLGGQSDSMQFNQSDTASKEFQRSGSKPITGNATASPEANEQQAREAYSVAFQFLKEGRYSEAVIGFQSFLSTYTNSRYSENAQYWLGEAHYASKSYDQALTEFKKVLNTYSGSTKVPGAKLKMGYTYYELQRWTEAREVLNDVLRNYPSSSVAPLAEKRLIRMTKEGH